MSYINNWSTYRFGRLRNPERFDNRSQRVIKRFSIFPAQRFQWVPKWLPLAYSSWMVLVWGKSDSVSGSLFFLWRSQNLPWRNRRVCVPPGSLSRDRASRNRERNSGRWLFTDCNCSVWAISSLFRATLCTTVWLCWVCWEVWNLKLSTTVSNRCLYNLTIGIE